jgi:hypothetical protein
MQFVQLLYIAGILARHLKMVTEATETCRRIVKRDKTYFINVNLLVFYINIPRYKVMEYIKLSSSTKHYFTPLLSKMLRRYITLNS